MAFVFEKVSSESGLKKIKSVMESLNKIMSPVQSWVVDSERNIAMYPMGGGNCRDNVVTPDEYVLTIGDQLVFFLGYQYGLFFSFEKKIRGIEYLVFLGSLPEKLIFTENDIKSFIRESMECYGHQLSSKMATVTEVNVRFIEDFYEFQNRYENGSM